MLEENKLNAYTNNQSTPLHEKQSLFIVKLKIQTCETQKLNQHCNISKHQTFDW